MNETEFGSKVISRKAGMYRLARNLLCDAAEAEDAVQDVLERLWKKREQVGALADPGAFILTSVRNACLDRLRSRKVRTSGAESAAAGECGTDPLRTHELADMKAIVQKAIAALPEKLRTTIHLRDVEGYTMEEIALILDMRQDIVRVYLSRARKQVREHLLTVMNYGIR